VYEVTDLKSGDWLANVPQGTRKDTRDAVGAARKAVGGWSGATAYNRGQILYRAAEMLQGRREQFAAEVAVSEGVSAKRAAALVEAAVDRWVWYAGWTDKVAQIAGSANPVAGPYFNLSTPEPTGVVGVVAPTRGNGFSLLGLVSVIAPVIATGNTAVVALAPEAPLPGLSLGEVLATSDLPGGVVNLISGRTEDIAPTLASHQDVNALDLTGVNSPEGPGSARALETLAADTLKRVRRPEVTDDWTAAQGTDRLLAFLETKTVWHPMGI
jgi:acyl-CoA reductase-like NAD-dependent aldehyde dehydrogenase